LRIDFDRGVFFGRHAKWTEIEGSIEPNWMHHAVMREWQAMKAAIEGTAPVPVTGTYARHIVSVGKTVHQASAARREIEVSHV
jgi:phthalate 4,5-cis-dihydrodiol dehydrogenase